MQPPLPGAPLMMHLCGPAGCSKGKHRIVAPVSSLTRFSSSSLPLPSAARPLARLDGDELLVRAHVDDKRIPERPRLRQIRSLHVVQGPADLGTPGMSVRRYLRRTPSLPRPVPPGDDARVLRHVLRANLRRGVAALHLPTAQTSTPGVAIVVVHLDAYPPRSSTWWRWRSRRLRPPPCPCSSARWARPTT